jgi:hypothetical protein
MARGGINQQRQQICDTVALAQYLGARLVVPELSWSDAWRDNTTFKKVFDLPVRIVPRRRSVHKHASGCACVSLTHSA